MIILAKQRTLLIILLKRRSYLPNRTVPAPDSRGRGKIRCWVDPDSSRTVPVPDYLAASIIPGKRVFKPTRTLYLAKTFRACVRTGLAKSSPAGTAESQSSARFVAHSLKTNQLSWLIAITPAGTAESQSSARFVAHPPKTNQLSWLIAITPAGTAESQSSARFVAHPPKTNQLSWLIAISPAGTAESQPSARFVSAPAENKSALLAYRNQSRRDGWE